MRQESSEIALMVADSVDVMLGYWDRDQRCLFANEAYRTWFGKSRKQLIGITMKELLGPLYEMNLPYIRAALAGEPQLFERVIPLPDGSIRQSLASYFPDVVNGKVLGFSVQVTDVTRLKHFEERFAAAAESSLSAFFILEAARDEAGEIFDFRFAFLNARAGDLIRRSPSNAVGKLLCEEYPINRTGGFFEKYKAVVETGVPLDESFSISDAEIDASWLHYQVFRLGDGVAITTHDISANKRLEHDLAKASAFTQSVIDASPFSTIVTDLDGLIVAVNPATERMLWYSRSEMVGQMTPLSIHDPAELKARALQLSEELGRTVEPNVQVFMIKPRTGLTDEGEWTYVRKDGSRLHIQLSVTALHDKDDTITGYMGVAYDITERKRQRDYISHIAHHDALTGLPTRVLFKDRVDITINRLARYGGTCAVMVIDLDNFKDINDSLGHHAGDEVLTAVGKRLSSALRVTDTVSRLGGDEFTVLLDQIRSDDDAPFVAQKLLDALAAPLQLGDEELTLSASIGISLFPEGGRNSTALLKNADAAMYHAKATGKQRYLLFTQSLADASTRRLHVEMALKKALELGEFSLVYQPQVLLADGAIVGVEALVRWKNERLGPIPPFEFIPVAEQCGVIGPLGEWIFTQACSDIQMVAAASGRHLRLAVNVSPRQLERAGFPAFVARTLRTTGFPPERFELEITEGLFMSDSSQVWEALKEIQTLGVGIAMDDFGTGFSNVSYLLKLAVNRIKIDRSFVSRLEEDPGCNAVVSSLINMADALGVAIIAEGVETEAQAEILRSKGCLEAQGYLYFRPTDAANLAEILIQAAGAP